MVEGEEFKKKKLYDEIVYLLESKWKKERELTLQVKGLIRAYALDSLEEVWNAARRDFAEEINDFLIKTSTEDDTARLRKLNDWIIKENELKPIA